MAGRGEAVERVLKGVLDEHYIREVGDPDQRGSPFPADRTGLGPAASALPAADFDAAIRAAIDAAEATRARPGDLGREVLARPTPAGDPKFRVGDQDGASAVSAREAQETAAAGGVVAHTHPGGKALNAVLSQSDLQAFRDLAREARDLEFYAVSRPDLDSDQVSATGLSGLTDKGRRLLTPHMAEAAAGAAARRLAPGDLSRYLPRGQNVDYTRTLLSNLAVLQAGQARGLWTLHERFAGMDARLLAALSEGEGAPFARMVQDAGRRLDRGDARGAAYAYVAAISAVGAAAAGVMHQARGADLDAPPDAGMTAEEAEDEAWGDGLRQAGIDPDTFLPIVEPDPTPDRTKAPDLDGEEDVYPRQTRRNAPGPVPWWEDPSQGADMGVLFNDEQIDTERGQARTLRTFLREDVPEFFAEDGPTIYQHAQLEAFEAARGLWREYQDVVLDPMYQEYIDFYEALERGETVEPPNPRLDVFKLAPAALAHGAGLDLADRTLRDETGAPVKFTIDGIDAPTTDIGRVVQPFIQAYSTFRIAQKAAPILQSNHAALSAAVKSGRLSAIVGRSGQEIGKAGTAGGVSDFIGFEGSDATITDTLSEIFPDNATLQSELLDVFRTAEDESEFEKRAAQAMEGVVLGVAFDLSLLGLSGLWRGAKARADAADTILDAPLPDGPVDAGARGASHAARQGEAPASEPPPFDERPGGGDSGYVEKLERLTGDSRFEISPDPDLFVADGTLEVTQAGRLRADFDKLADKGFAAVDLGTEDPIYWNKNRINAPDDVLAMMQHMLETRREAVDAFSRGEKRTFQDYEREAAHLNAFDVLLNARPGQVFNVEEQHVLRVLHASSADQTMRSAERALKTRDRSDIAFAARSLEQHAMISEVAKAQSREIARALGARRMTVGSDARTRRRLDAIARAGGEGGPDGHAAMMDRARRFGSEEAGLDGRPDSDAPLRQRIQLEDTDEIFRITRGTEAEMLAEVDRIIAASGGESAILRRLKEVAELGPNQFDALETSARNAKHLMSRAYSELVVMQHLQNPQTHMINIGDTGTNVLKQILDVWAARHLRPIIRPLSQLTPGPVRMDAAQHVAHGEAGAMAQGMMIGFNNALRHLSRKLEGLGQKARAARREAEANGEPPPRYADERFVRLRDVARNSNNKIDLDTRRSAVRQFIEEETPLKHQPAVAKAAGQMLGGLIAWPGHALSMSDDFFKVMMISAEARRAAFNRALSLQERGALGAGDFAGKVREIYDGAVFDFDPRYNDIRSEALKRAERATYTETISHNRFEAPFTNIARLISRVPVAGRLVVPFINTGSNIWLESLEHTPLAWLSHRFRDAIREGGAAKQRAITRLWMGNMLIMAVAHQTFAGNITGSGPADREQFRSKFDTGWRPNSIAVPWFSNGAWGRRYFAYSRLGWLGTVLGLTASTVEISFMTDRHQDSNQNNNTLLYGLVAAVASQINAKTYMRGISDLAEFQANPQMNYRYMDRQLAHLFSTPFGAIAGQARTLRKSGVPGVIEPDPYLRETGVQDVFGGGTLLENPMAQLTGMVNELRNRTVGLSKDLPLARDQWGRPISFESGLGTIYDIVSPIYSRADHAAEPIDLEEQKERFQLSMPAKALTVFGGRVSLAQRMDVYSRMLEIAGGEVTMPLGGEEFTLLETMNGIVTGKPEQFARAHARYQALHGGPGKGKSTKEGFLRHYAGLFYDVARQRVVEELIAADDPLLRVGGAIGAKARSDTPNLERAQALTDRAIDRQVARSQARYAAAGREPPTFEGAPRIGRDASPAAPDPGGDQ